MCFGGASWNKWKKRSGIFLAFCIAAMGMVGIRLSREAVYEKIWFPYAKSTFFYLKYSPFSGELFDLIPEKIEKAEARIEGGEGWYAIEQEDAQELALLLNSFRYHTWGFDQTGDSRTFRQHSFSPWGQITICNQGWESLKWCKLTLNYEKDRLYMGVNAQRQDGRSYRGVLTFFCGEGYVAKLDAFCREACGLASGKNKAE